MPFGGFGPRLWHPVLPEQDVVDSCTDLVRTGVWPNFSDACSQSRHGDRLYSVGNLISRKCTGRESTMRYQYKDCPRGQIGIYRFSEVHRNTHCRRGNEERDLAVTGLDDVRVAYNELAVMMVKYVPPEPGLNISAEVIKVESINAALHEAVAVRRAHDSVALEIDD